MRNFLRTLRREGEIVDVFEAVDPHLELAEIHRRVAAAEGPALLFHNVKGSTFPVATNLFGSLKRVELAFPTRPEQLVRDLVNLATGEFPPPLWKNRKTLGKLLKLGTRKRKGGPVLEQTMAKTDLEKLPLLTSWPEDGGPFITLPLVYTQSPHNGTPNLGMYRVHRYDKETTGLHWQIGKGGGFHYHQAEQLDQPLPVSIFVGGHPALMLSAIAPLPENVPELMLTSLLQGKKLNLVQKKGWDHPVIAEAEFALVGHAEPHKRRLEGPFGDHYGYYSLAHDFPVFNCKKIHHRKDAIYPATVVGKPRQEDFYIGDFLQELLSPLFPVVMPGVRDLWSYGETGFHSLSAAVVRERYHRECMASAFRILGEGQLSLTKFLLLTDQPTDLRDFRKTLTTVLERFRPETDLFIFSNLSLDTLDYTGPELNKGSRGIMLGIGPKIRELPTIAPPGAIAFCPGCLVVDQPIKNTDDWPLVILVDDAKKATQNVTTFLWTVFTRFEPAADITAQSSTVHRHHICYSGSIHIDARMKPSYPKEVLCDPDTHSLVTDRWNNYFPNKMEMGDSQTAHVS